MSFSSPEKCKKQGKRPTKPRNGASSAPLLGLPASRSVSPYSLFPSKIGPNLLPKDKISHYSFVRALSQNHRRWRLCTNTKIPVESQQVLLAPDRVGTFCLHFLYRSQTPEPGNHSMGTGSGTLLSPGPLYRTQMPGVWRDAYVFCLSAGRLSPSHPVQYILDTCRRSPID